MDFNSILLVGLALSAFLLVVFVATPIVYFLYHKWLEQKNQNAANLQK